MGPYSIDGWCEVAIGRQQVRGVEFVALGHHDNVDGQKDINGFFDIGRGRMFRRAMSYRSR